MKVHLGIDFGTTNTAAALTLAHKTHILNLNNGSGDEKTLRSVLFIAPSGEIFIGQKALAEFLSSDDVATNRNALKQFSTIDGNGTVHFFDESLEKFLLQEPKRGRLMQSFKSFLSAPSLPKVRVGEKYEEMLTLLALFFTHIKTIAEKEAGEMIFSVTVGRPVVFSTDTLSDARAENRLIEAAQRAGFTEVRIEYEPVAACLSYLDEVSSVKTVLVGDFGGGTSDFTVMRLSKKDGRTEYTLLSKGGVYIGGDTFNGALMSQIVAPYFGKNVTHAISDTQRGHMPYSLTAKLSEWHKLPFMNDRATMDTIAQIRLTADDAAALDRLTYLITSNKGYYVYRAIDDAKIELSELEGSRIMYEDAVLSLTKDIQRSEFERLISEDVSILSSCIQRTVEDAGEEQSIDAVLLTGGTSFIPKVRSVFTQLYPTTPILQLDAFTSVAFGLARSAEAGMKSTRTKSAIS